MRKLFLIIPFSAATIAAAVGYRLARPSALSLATPTDAAFEARPAPLFQLYDEHSQIVRLARYLGRHKLLVVFFDGRQGPDGSPLLRELRRDYPQIHETGAILLAISSLRPAEHRQGIERDASFPFPMLSDLDGTVHQQWGASDPATGNPREAVFLIDRGGIIRRAHFGPDDLGHSADWIAELHGLAATR